MNYSTVIILAIGLSFDTFAVSVTSGLSLPAIRFFQAVKLALILAVFQAFMPLIGWLLESSVRRLIEPVDHWIAFGLLSLIGGKMIIENLLPHETKSIKDPLKFRTAVIMAFATSVDALAVGFSLALLLEKIIPAVIIIGAVTFLASMTGVLIGKKTGPRINKYAEILGGAILIFIGIKILFEHLMAS
ncbi:manganese efflux pump MntP family protein [Gaoshiqia sediminis]|uniref:Putative manganese efflux pump MntP n=1 Tax=Gaoshiqia sediminis TaxID=2986998 RepID=A0AA41YCI9_9BACT|nr:manganese efflux pump MntP family protein [Gaoshiqia sediminis]MCW0482502.1 manganese efflux pump MntP family protein [Gaoshiqia sediminis]